MKNKKLLLIILILTIPLLLQYYNSDNYYDSGFSEGLKVGIEEKNVFITTLLKGELLLSYDDKNYIFVLSEVEK